MDEKLEDNLSNAVDEFERSVKNFIAVWEAVRNGGQISTQSGEKIGDHDEKLEKYFEEQFKKLDGCIYFDSSYPRLCTDAITIIEQIYLAGCRKQGEMDMGAVNKLLIRVDVDGDVIEHNMAINEALCALKSAQ